eukprot:Partr_v1_DN28347_c0_g1_i3_m78755 putative solute carrier family 35 member
MQSPKESTDSISSHDDRDDRDDPEIQKPVLVKQERSLVFVAAWIVANIVSTIAIVFVNKHIFSDRNLVRMPVSFAAFHFACTSSYLWAASQFGMFERKRISIKAVLPLCSVFAANVIFPNLSLAYSSVIVYQLLRTTITPLVAMINFVLYQVKIKGITMFSILLICIGVGLATYADSISKDQSTGRTTSMFGLIAGFLGVSAGAMYAIWIGRYGKEYSLSPLQLLFNQAPVATVMLLCLAPFSDTVPKMSEVSSESMYLIGLSGLLAIVINLSQFFIVQYTSALSSTLVGHSKTCLIIAIGWTYAGEVNPNTLVGILLAISGIFLYSYIQLPASAKGNLNFSYDQLPSVSTLRKKPMFRISCGIIAAIVLLSFVFSKSGGSSLAAGTPIKILLAFPSVGSLAARNDIVKRNIDLLRNQSLAVSHKYDVQCIVFSYTSYDKQPEWFHRMESGNDDFCSGVTMFQTKFVPMIKQLQPEFLQDSGYNYLSLILDDVSLTPEDGGKFDLETFFDIAVYHNISVISPSIYGTPHLELRTKNLGMRKVGRFVDMIEFQAITFRIDAWSCIYNLVDTEYPSGWGTDVWYWDYCNASGRVKDASLGIVDTMVAFHHDFPSTMDGSQNELFEKQIAAWKNQRGIELTPHVAKTLGWISQPW